MYLENKSKSYMFYNSVKCISQSPIRKQKPYWVVPKDQSITMRYLLVLLSRLIIDYLSFICALYSLILILINEIIRGPNLWQKPVHWVAFLASDPFLGCASSYPWGRGTAHYLINIQIIKNFKYNLMDWINSLKDYIQN